MLEDTDTLDRDSQYLPIANVSRIMKRGLPLNSKIAKDSKEIIQECVSEFISFITSEASDKCAHEKRKTITAEDVLWAMSSLGFDSYHDVLKLYLQNYKEKPSKAKKKEDLVQQFLTRPSMLSTASQLQQMADLLQNHQDPPLQVENQNDLISGQNSLSNSSSINDESSQI